MVAENICRVVAPYCASRIINAARVRGGVCADTEIDSAGESWHHHAGKESGTSTEAMVLCLCRLASMRQLGDSGEPVSTFAMEVR